MNAKKAKALRKLVRAAAQPGVQQVVMMGRKHERRVHIERKPGVFEPATMSTVELRVHPQSVRGAYLNAKRRIRSGA